MNVQFQTELRRELHAFIDTIPPKRLIALRPLLADLAEPDFVIESDLTEEEMELIAEGGREFGNSWKESRLIRQSYPAIPGI